MDVEIDEVDVNPNLDHVLGMRLRTVEKSYCPFGEVYCFHRS